MHALLRDRHPVLEQDRRVGNRVVQGLAVLAGEDGLVLVGEDRVALSGGGFFGGRAGGGGPLPPRGEKGVPGRPPPRPGGAPFFPLPPPGPEVSAWPARR